MTTNAHDLYKLYAQVEAVRAKAAALGLCALDEILTTALVEIQRKVNSLAGHEAFTAPRLRH